MNAPPSKPSSRTQDITWDGTAWVARFKGRLIGRFSNRIDAAQELEHEIKRVSSRFAPTHLHPYQGLK